MIHSFSEITWGALGRMPLMVVPCLVALVLSYRCIKLARRASLLAGKNFTHLFYKNSPFLFVAKAILHSAGAFFFIVAMLKPMWDKKEESIMQEGRDLFIALDISRSMLAQDCIPDRLTCAKQKIKELVLSLESQRVALILFSGSAFVQCPLTSDYGAFFMFLDQVDVETIASGTTAVDQALKVTLDTIKANPGKKHKLLAIFTDGEDFSARLSQLKSDAKQESLKIFALGVGSAQGAPIPLYDHRGAVIGHQKDAQKKIVISCLNEPLLQALANDAGGMYVPMRDDKEDILAITKALNAFEKEAIEEKQISQAQDRYHYPLFVSFCCFALEWIL